ncbi:hypothetical protein JCM11251_001384 [Rhodosporidiobolus azoricus]
MARGYGRNNTSARQSEGGRGHSTSTTRRGGAGDDFSSDLDALAPLTTRAPSILHERLPRASYLSSLSRPSTESRSPAKAKSKLLVSDLDNTLFGPSGDGVVARPYLKTFIKYIMHPSTPYNLAIWTFSGRYYGIAHLRQVGMGKYLFDSDSLDSPKLKPGLLALWGYEDSGFTSRGQMAAGAPLKDLDLMWDFIHLTRHLEFGSSNSLIVDDQAPNARAQPDSIVNCPVFTNKSPDDDFLLAFIGVLEELAPESNFAASIASRHLFSGIPLSQLDRYVNLGRSTCTRLGIKVSRGTPYPDPAHVEQVKKAKVAVVGPIHDAAEEPREPHPGSLPFSRPVPKRLATGMPTGPTREYLAEASVPSRVGTWGRKGNRPLVVFDLDGTLYTRPPQNLEHFPMGEPAGRPYLRTMLQWLLRPESPWTVAIWTGSQKATAVRCLYELDLGLVGPDLIGSNKDQAELLHPKLVALWAREDFELTKEDYVSYVAVVKDLTRLWEYLAETGHGDFSPSNTVMVDDTPSKLRAQPSTLIAAPTYDYPLDPSPYTTTAQLDIFLLALVAMLDEIEPETNFVEYIGREKRWNEVPGKKQVMELAMKGVKVLKKAGIPAAAEGRGLIEGVEPTLREAGVRTARTAPPKTAIVVLPPKSTSALPSSGRSTSRLFTAALLPLSKDYKKPGVTSDTDNTTSSSVNGDTTDPDPNALEDDLPTASSWRSKVSTVGRLTRR